MLKIMVLVFTIQLAVVSTGYFMASNSIGDTFSELLLIVSEDNCLDDTVMYNGSTTAKKFRNKLDTINNNNGMLYYDSNAVQVQYTSRDTAPQKGSLVNVKLTGRYQANFSLFGGMRVDVPIVREDRVIGTKYYRDR